MSQGHYIALSRHRLMLLDETRMDAFRRAIRETVRPGDVVVDLGTGTGVLALWAAEAGASRVFAIEPAPIVGIARRLARDNPRGDRITFLQADARDVELPEPADVLISECMGNFFVTDDLAPVLRDARRLIRPGARVLPSRIRLWMAPVFYPLLDDVSFWDTPVHGLDLSAARWHALRVTYVRHLAPQMVLAEPAELVAFDTLDAPDRVAGTLSFQLLQKGTIHAIAGWFDADLSPGVALSTGPGTDTHWAQLLFPIEPVRVPAGGRIDASVDLVLHDDYRCSWRWWGTVHDAEGAPLSEFDHDTTQRFDPP